MSQSKSKKHWVIKQGLLGYKTRFLGLINKVYWVDLGVSVGGGVCGVVHHGKLPFAPVGRLVALCGVFMVGVVCYHSPPHKSRLQGVLWLHFLVGWSVPLSVGV